jgi:uroporphyrinogen decarboxylase
MNARERFHETVSLGNPDRVPYWEMGFWPQTIDRWQDEGMPPDVHLDAFFGFDRRDGVPLNAGMIPTFREETVEEDDRQIIYRRTDGVVTRAMKTGARHGVRLSMDQHISFPVRDRASFREFAKRFNARSPCRYPRFWEEYKRNVRDRDYPLSIGGGSLFGWPRNWMGLENIAVAFYDDPGLIHEMMDFIADFIITLITPALEQIPGIDFGVFWEDMCYKTASMISPKHFREFMVPRYRRITDLMRKHGIRCMMVDSDGHVDELIPLWLEAGINFVYPLEVASDEDPVKLKREFGKDVLLWGGIDKRVLAEDKAAIKRELESKAPFLLEQGGWIPGIDHAVPPDVSYENYLYYRELLAQMVEGKA